MSCFSPNQSLFAKSIIVTMSRCGGPQNNWDLGPILMSGAFKKETCVYHSIMTVDTIPAHSFLQTATKGDFYHRCPLNCVLVLLCCIMVLGSVL